MKADTPTDGKSADKNGFFGRKNLLKTNSFDKNIHIKLYKYHQNFNISK